MALGPAASTPVQHPPQHAVKNPSHLPAALAPNTPSPSPPTTRSWCEITGQDQASAHQVKRRYRRGIRYEPSSCNKSPPFYNETDVLTCHIHHKRISCRDRTDSEIIWTLPESCLAPPGRRIQVVPLVLHCSQWRPNAAATVTVPRGAPVPPAPRWMETATRCWCITVGHKVWLLTALPHFKCPCNHPLHRLLSLLWTAMLPRLLSFFLSPEKAFKSIFSLMKEHHFWPLIKIII